MKQNALYKRILSMLLTAALLLSICPTAVFAEELPNVEEIPEIQQFEDVTIDPEPETQESPASDAEEVPEELPEVIQEEAVEISDADTELDAQQQSDPETLSEWLASVTTGTTITVDANGLILLSNVEEDLTGKTVYFSAIAGDYADLTGTVTLGEQSYTFRGLGCAAYPFNAAIESQMQTYGVILNRPLFNYLNTEIPLTNLTTLRIKSAADGTVLLADHISGTASSGWAALSVVAEKQRITDGGTNYDSYPGALLGEITGNASLSLASVAYDDNAIVSSTENAGLLCNTIRAGGSLSIGALSLGEHTVSITAGNTGSAGGLVGVMEASASLTVTNAVTINSSFTIQGGYAGGLLGSGTDVVISGVNAQINGAIIKAKTAGGGVFGQYTTNHIDGTYVQYNGAAGAVPTCVSVAHQATDHNAFVGGIIGALVLAGDFEIADASVTVTVADTRPNAGGLVGTVYSTSAYANLCALTVSGTNSVTLTNSTALASCGAAVAVVGSSENKFGVYTVLSGSFTGTVSGVERLGDQQYYGGFIAKLMDNSVAEIAEGATLTPSTGTGSIKYGGGVAGYAAKGSTLRLAGVTDLGAIKFSADYVQTAGSVTEAKNFGGQLVGVIDCALVYAAQSWELKRPTTVQAVDDIGNYGTVIRLGKNVGRGASNLGVAPGLSANLISQDAVTHKTTFSKTLTISPKVLLSDADDYALAVIAEQCMGYFAVSSAVQGRYLFQYYPNIELTGDIDLRNTGLGSLQRDQWIQEYGYWGSFVGGGKTITLAIGEVYGTRDGGTVAVDVAGSGQIHRHSMVGLFSKFNGSSVSNLSLTGTINLWECNDTRKYVGGFAAGNYGAISFNGVNTAVTINCYGSGNQASQLGGLIGYKYGGTLRINSVDTVGTAGTDTSYCNTTMNGNTNTAVCFGGLIGFLYGDATISNVSLGGSITLGDVTDARVGGLIAGMNSSHTVYLRGITVDGQTVTANASQTCGGLLGYDWAGTTVVFGDAASHNNGVTVQGTSALQVSGAAESGVLVYTATGYWQVNHISLQKLSASSGNGALGLLLCRGKRSTGAGGLYLELTDAAAYPINSSDVVISSTGGAFDELCVYTSSEARLVPGNANSVISIATADLLVDNANGNAYQNRTQNYNAETNSSTPWEFHPNNRYYYNLHAFRASASGEIDTPQELTLWSAYRYGLGAVNGTLLGVTDAITGLTIGGENASNIDLTGYSYYPINLDNLNLTVKNCTITFANAQIEAAEAANNGGTDGLIRTTQGTADSHSPHYLMHTGLILNFANTSTSGSDDVRTLTVRNVTLAGNVGQTTDGSGTGALVSRNFLGATVNGANHVAKMDVDGLTLSGLYANAPKDTAHYAPLLVNRVGSYSNVTVKNLTTTAYSGYSATNPAATSLIGNVGSDTAKYINLAFEGINLSGRIGAWAENTAVGAGTGGSVFSHATLLESFSYGDAASSGYYHFVAADQYTYGKEISRSLENAGLQTNFYNTLVAVTDGENTDFSTGYLPYVCRTAVNDSQITSTTFHELEVNVVKPDLNDGCGTYDDPYIISTALQLSMVAQFVNTGNAQNGWKVNMVNNPDAVGADNHTEYEVGAASWNNAAMRAYLSGAYYKLVPEDPENPGTTGTTLQLDSYAGLGTKDDPFTGVIEGNGKTLIINAEKCSGLINVSNGSVVRNLTLIYQGTATLNGTVEKNSATVESGTCFGGIIGTVKGGDNLIENVTVSFADDFSLVLNNECHCAGGFVGLVQAGGVILRSMPAQAGLSGTALYRDAYFGRVLDGYVIHETAQIGTTVTFDGENYAVPDIDSSNSTNTAGLVWNSGNITISNAQQLIMLCDILSSGSANGGSCSAYTSGAAKVRNADYSQIGNISSADSAVFLASRRDDTSIGTGSYPYLVSRYTDTPASFFYACDAGISLTFGNSVQIDLTPYKNGYRGIGGRYNCTANDGDLSKNVPLSANVTGNASVLQVAIDQKESRNDNFFASAVGGLFNVLRHNGATVSELSIYGTVKISSGLEAVAKSVFGDEMITHAAVGGFVGRDYSANNTSTGDLLLLDNLTFGSGTVTGNLVYGESHSGGMIGFAGSRAFYPFSGYKNTDGVNSSLLKVQDCAYINLEVVGGETAGGLVGRVTFNSMYLGGFNVLNDSFKKWTLTIDNTQDVYSTGSNVIRNFYALTGQSNNQKYSTSYINENEQNANAVGSILGVSVNSCVIGSTEHSINISGVKVYGPSSSTRCGGAIGFLTYRGATSACSTTITNIHLDNVIVGNIGVNDKLGTKVDNAGGLLATWWQEGLLTVNNCSVTNSKIYGNSVGGVIGYFDKSPCRLSGITVDHCSVFSGSGTAAGGVIGNVNYNNNSKNLMLWDITVSNTTFKNQATNNGMVVGIMKAYANMHNVLLKNNDFAAYTSANDAKYGRISGTGDNIRVIGLSVQQSDSLLSRLPTREVGNKAYSYYLDTTNNTLGNKQYFIYDAYMNEAVTAAGDLASMPTATIPGLGNLLGDTLTPSTVIAAAADSVRYQNYRTANGITEDSQNKVVEGIGTTYNEQQTTQLADGQNFETLLVDGDASVIRQYLNVATNGGYQAMLRIENWWGTRTTQRMRMTVSVDRYRYDEEQGIFTIAEDLKPTLVFHKDTGEFTTTSQYDNQMGTFTMITIKMQGEPKHDLTEGTAADRQAVTRIIHIPVIVRRMLQIDFTATMAAGTVFNANEMDSFRTHALASAGEDITGYITVRYNSVGNVEQNFDWENYMESGGNLLGSFNKTIDTGTTVLPEGTRITLIDCQNQDRRYSATVGAGGSDLELFSTGNLNFVDGSGNAFAATSLSTLLEIAAVTDEDGSWVRLESSAGATVQDQAGNYYRLKEENGETATEFYSLTVGNDSPVENYFVVINVPVASTHKMTLDKTGLTWNSTTTAAPPVEVLQIHRYNSQQLKSGQSEASFNYLNNYVQTLTDETQSGGVAIDMNTATVRMPIHITNEVTFDKNNYESTDALYQQLVLKLKQTVGERSTDIVFPGDARAEGVKLYAYYIDAGGVKHYFVYNSETGGFTDSGAVKKAAVTYNLTCDADGIMRLPFAASGAAGTAGCIDLRLLREAAKNQQKFYLEAEAEIQIPYNSVFTNSTIPTNETEELLNYTQVDATSYLSFTRSGVANSTIRGTTVGRTSIRKYYLKQKHEAVLTLDYVSLDQLAINPWDGEIGEIDTVLTFDLSNADGFNADASRFNLLKDADSIVFTFGLLQKQEDGSYSAVAIGDYLTGTEPAAVQTNGYTMTIAKNSDGSWPGYNESSGTFTIPVHFSVDTSRKYANYRICVTAAMEDSNHQAVAVGINEEEAFITYTLAKINVNGIWPAGETN